MEHRRIRSCIAAAQSDPSQSHRQIGVLIAPADEPHVDAVHRFEVRSCDTRAEAVRVAGRRKVRKPAPPGSTTVSWREVPPAANVAASPHQQCRSAPTLDRCPIVQDGTRQSFAQLEPCPGQKPARQRGPAHRLDEVRARDAVAVDEDEIAPASRGSPEVPDTSQPKTFIGLPRVREAFSETLTSTDSTTAPVDSVEPSSATTTSKAGSDWPPTPGGRHRELPATRTSTHDAHARLARSNGSFDELAGRCGAGRPVQRDGRSIVHSSFGRTTPRHWPANVPRAESPSPGSSTSNEIAS